MIKARVRFYQMHSLTKVLKCVAYSTYHIFKEKANENRLDIRLLALWRGLTIQARRFASRSSTRQTTHLNSDKKVNSKPSETGRSPLNRLANRPVVLRAAAKFWVLCLLYLPSVFGCVLFRAVFPCAVLFLLPQKPFFSPFRVWLYSLKTSKIHAKPISTHSRFFIGVWYNRRCYNDITFWYISVT